MLDAVRKRLDNNLQAMQQRRKTVEHPFCTLKARMNATHFLNKAVTYRQTETVLTVLAYNLTRGGTKPLMAAYGHEDLFARREEGKRPLNLS